MTIALRRGEVHAILGENGAGGIHAHEDDGWRRAAHPRATDRRWKGGPPQDAERSPETGNRHGFRDQPGADYDGGRTFFWPGRFFNCLRGIYIAAQQFMQSLNFDVNPVMTVNQLGAAKKQMVEIARAVLQEAKVIIFDEPTATLTSGGEEGISFSS
ncbi:MAG: ATP-binding cassette domain-containing protein [Burkholderiaceae bacterium]